MLNMGFTDSINAILADVPQERNTCLLYTSMPSAMLRVNGSPKMAMPTHTAVTGSIAPNTDVSVEPMFLMARTSARSVSYTHLDVYKRQILFMIEKYGKAGDLIRELKIVSGK